MDENGKKDLQEQLDLLTAQLEEAKGKKVLPQKKKPLWKKITGAAAWIVSLTVDGIIGGVGVVSFRLG